MAKFKGEDLKEKIVYNYRGTENTCMKACVLSLITCFGIVQFSRGGVETTEFLVTEIRSHQLFLGSSQCSTLDGCYKSALGFTTFWFLRIQTVHLRWVMVAMESLEQVHELIKTALYRRLYLTILHACR